MFLAGAGNLGPGGKNPHAHALRGLFPVQQGLGRGEGAPVPCCACTKQPAQCLALKAEESQALAADGSSKKLIWVLGICRMCPKSLPACFTKGQLNPKHLRRPSGVVAPAPSQAPQPKLLFFCSKARMETLPLLLCFSFPAPEPSRIAAVLWIWPQPNTSRSEQGSGVLPAAPRVPQTPHFPATRPR